MSDKHKASPEDKKRRTNEDRRWWNESDDDRAYRRHSDLQKMDELREYFRKTTPWEGDR